MNNLHFFNFQRMTIAVYFTYLESITVYRSTCKAGCLSERPKTSMFGSSKLSYLLRLMDMSAPFLHIESTGTMVFHLNLLVSCQLIYCFLLMVASLTLLCYNIDH